MDIHLLLIILDKYHSFLQQGDTEFRNLTNFPTNISAGIFRPFANVLIAGNLIRNTDTEQPGTILISSQAAPGAIPSSYIPSSGNVTADEFELSNTSPVTEIADYRGTGYVFTEDSIHSLILGTTNSPTRVNTLNTGVGCLAPDCVTTYEGGMFVVDRNDIYITNGSGKIESVSNHKIREYFLNNLNPTFYRNTFTAANTPRDEIWVCFPNLSVDTDGACNEALIWNYRDNTWSIRDLPNAFAATLGPIPGSDGLFDKARFYLTFNGFNITAGSQQQETVVTGNQSNNNPDGAAMFQWRLQGNPNVARDGVAEVQTLTVAGRQENIPGVIDVQSFTAAGRSNVIPDQDREIVDFGFEFPFVGGVDSDAEYQDWTFGGSFTAFTPAASNGTYSFFGGSSAIAVSHVNNSQISTITQLIDYVISSYNADTSGKEYSLSRVGSNVLRLSALNTTSAARTVINRSTVSFGCTSFDHNLTGLTYSVSSPQFASTYTGVAGNGGWVANVSNVFDSNPVILNGSRSRTTYSIRGPKYLSHSASGGVTFTSRSPAGALGNGRWDVRDTETVGSGNQVNYSNWSQWEKQYLQLDYNGLDGADGIIHWETGDLITITNNTAFASFLIGTVYRNDSAEEISFELDELTFQTGTPGVGTLVVRNDNAVLLSGTLANYASSTAARTTIKSALDNDSDFQRSFIFDQDTDIAAVAGGWLCTINSFPTLSANDNFVIVDLPIGITINNIISVTTTDTIENVIDKILALYNPHVPTGITLTKVGTNSIRVNNTSNTRIRSRRFANSLDRDWGFASLTGSSGTLSLTMTDINDSTNTYTGSDTASPYIVGLVFSQGSGASAFRAARYRARDDGDFGDFSFTLTSNGADYVTPYLEVVQEGGASIIPRSLYEVFDFESREITTFSSTANDTDVNDRSNVLDRIRDSINRNIETPINYNAVVSSDTITITATTVGDPGGNWAININHGTGNGNLTLTHATVTQGVTPQDGRVIYRFVDPVDTDTERAVTLTGTLDSDDIAQGIRNQLLTPGWTLSGTGNQVAFTRDTEGHIPELWTYADSEIHNNNTGGVSGTFAETTPGVTHVDPSGVVLISLDGSITFLIGQISSGADTDTAGTDIANISSLRGDMTYDTDSDILTFTFDTIGEQGRPSLLITNPSPGTGNLNVTPLGSDTSGSSSATIIPTIYTIASPAGFSPTTTTVSIGGQTLIETLNTIRDTINNITFTPVDVSVSVVGTNLIFTWSDFNVSSTFLFTIDNQGGNGDLAFTDGTLSIADGRSTRIHAADQSNTFNGEAFTAFVERKVLDIGDLEATKWTGSIYPLMSGDGNIIINVDGTNVAGRLIDFTQVADQQFDIDQDYKADPRTKGRFLNIRFESTDNNTWKLDGYSITAQIEDKR